MARRDEHPDERTPERAMALAIEAINAVPDDACGVDVSIGQRLDGGWYWCVTWRLSTGTKNTGPAAGFDRTRALANAAKIYGEALVGARTEALQNALQALVRVAREALGGTTTRGLHDYLDAHYPEATDD